ncbi:ER membrane complex subunit 6 [Terramyces sp. JEL0728]|nr:ER membrane complex subunit 6 [Terramyces sp. JEL0728]
MQSPMENTVTSPDAIRYNLKTISKIRASTALVSGLAAGILGLENLSGFLFYLITSIILSVFLLVFKLGFQPTKFLPAFETVFTFDVSGNLSSFVLFWVLATGVCHIYE